MMWENIFLNDRWIQVILGSIYTISMQGQMKVTLSEWEKNG